MTTTEQVKAITELTNRVNSLLRIMQTSENKQTKENCYLIIDNLLLFAYKIGIISAKNWADMSDINRQAYGSMI